MAAPTRRKRLTRHFPRAGPDPGGTGPNMSRGPAPSWARPADGIADPRARTVFRDPDPRHPQRKRDGPDKGVSNEWSRKLLQNMHQECNRGSPKSDIQPFLDSKLSFVRISRTIRVLHIGIFDN